MMGRFVGWMRDQVARSAVLILSFDFLAMVLICLRAGWLWLRCELWSWTIVLLLLSLLPLMLTVLVHKEDVNRKYASTLRMLIALWLIVFAGAIFEFWTCIPAVGDQDIRILRQIQPADRVR
jgi:hypothetical protein